MKTTLFTVGALALSLIGTGCATKKYVVKTITPVADRVTATEGKNVDQDKQIASNDKEIGEIGTDLSRTKERLNDVDAKAIAAGTAAQQAGQRADAAQTSADGARTLAQTGNERAETVGRNVETLNTTITRTVTAIDGLNKYQMLKTETVLFAVGQSKLSAESKAQLDDIAKSTFGQERFMVEVQGFTDKTGSPQTNEELSQARAAEVTRYLVNQHKVPVRTISAIGSGYAQPIGDDKTRDGRAQNRRVEVRVFTPEVASAVKALASR